MPRLLGRYENFPEIIHGVGRFICRSPTSKAQHVILRTLKKLNEKAFSLKDVATFSSAECEVSFEFGIADGIEFNYLDEEELDRLGKSISKKPLSTLDFLCVVRYHIIKSGKRVPLKFDYHMLRFIFYDKNNLEMQMSHQRGIRHVPVEDLIAFVTKRINEDLRRNRLKSLESKNS